MALVLQHQLVSPFGCLKGVYKELYADLGAVITGCNDRILHAGVVGNQGVTLGWLATLSLSFFFFLAKSSALRAL